MAPTEKLGQSIETHVGKTYRTTGRRPLRTSARKLAETQQQVKHQEQIAASAKTEIVGPSVSLSSATATYALRFYEAKKLLSEGYSLRAVSRMLSMSRKTLDRYRYLETYPAKGFSKRSSTVLPWKEYLIKRWNAGTYNRKQLWPPWNGERYKHKALRVTTSVSNVFSPILRGQRYYLYPS